MSHPAPAKGLVNIHTHTYTKFQYVFISLFLSLSVCLSISIYIYIYIYIYSLRRKSEEEEYQIWVLNVRDYQRMINLGLKIHLNLTCGAKKIFLYKNKKKIYFFGVIINLFLVVMTIIRCCTKKILFGYSYIASSKNGISKFLQI